MAFLAESDYTVQLRSEIAAIIDTSGTRSKLKIAEDMAIAQAKNYLSSRVNLDLVFVNAPATGETDMRDPFMVMSIIDLALYHLWSKEGGNKIPQTRVDRYADALEWLKAVQKGAATNLPLLTDEDDEVISDIRIWSDHTRESNRY